MNTRKGELAAKMIDRSQKKKETQTTDWLIEGMSKEELAVERVLAVVAGRLQLKRIDMGLSQKEFAKLLGVSQGIVSRWESGTYNFSLATLAAVCSKLGASLDPRITDSVEEEKEQ